VSIYRYPARPQAGGNFAGLIFCASIVAQSHTHRGENFLTFCHPASETTGQAEGNLPFVTRLQPTPASPNKTGVHISAPRGKSSHADRSPVRCPRGHRASDQALVWWCSCGCVQQLQLGHLAADFFHLGLRQRMQRPAARPARTIRGNAQRPSARQRFVQGPAFLIHCRDRAHAGIQRLRRAPIRRLRRDAQLDGRPSGIRLPTLGTMPSAPSFRTFSMSAPTPMKTEKSFLPPNRFQQFFTRCGLFSESLIARRRGWPSRPSTASSGMETNPSSGQVVDEQRPREAVQKRLCTSPAPFFQRHLFPRSADAPRPRRLRPEKIRSHGPSRPDAHRPSPTITSVRLLGAFDRQLDQLLWSPRGTYAPSPVVPSTKMPSTPPRICESTNTVQRAASSSVPRRRNRRHQRRPPHDISVRFSFKKLPRRLKTRLVNRYRVGFCDRARVVFQEPRHLHRGFRHRRDRRARDVQLRKFLRHAAVAGKLREEFHAMFRRGQRRTVTATPSATEMSA